MSDSCDVLILAHALDPITQRSTYTINLMARQFALAGLRVYFQNGIESQMPARLVINHVDLTITPKHYVQFLQQYPLALNGGLTNIAKEIVCRDTLVERDDDYVGPVIVKTRLNCGGLPEHGKLKLKRQIEREPAVADDVDWATRPTLDPEHYPIFANKESVPEAIWQNPFLVAQRLFVERDAAGRYCLRSWYVLGDHGFHVTTKADQPVVRGSNIVERNVVEMETPPSVVALRETMKVDFGRLDYVMCEEGAIVFDVNRTPTSTPGAVERYAAQWRDLALGIDRYL